MRNVRVLLIATALAATACSSGTDTIADDDQAARSAPSTEATSTQPSAPSPAATASSAPTDRYSDVNADAEPSSDRSVGGAIAIETTIDWDTNPTTGTFDVTDGAEVLGCQSGSVLEDGSPAGITNEFTCEGGSRDGTFTIIWKIIDGTEGPGEVNGPWRVESATGDFVGLTGEGTWSGVADEATGHGSFPGVVEFGPVDDAEVETADGSFESFLSNRLDDVWIPHDQGSVMAAIVEADGSVVHAARTPDADAVAVESDDVFRVGSITKVFTSALTLGLVEEGVVELDAPAGDYISGIAVPDGVTVRHLLGHRSGIVNYTNDEFFEQTRADDARVWTPEDVVGIVADQPAEFEPGAEFSYSNTNYVLLGMLIESVTGETYHEVLRSRIIDPLGMSNTYLAGFEEGPAVAVAHSAFFTGSVEPIVADYTSVATGAWSAGAMVSSAHDLHRFFTALFAGELVTEDLLAEMTTARHGYGLGIEADPMDVSEGLYGHGGSIMGFNAMVMHAPETGRTGFFVGTSDDVDPYAAVAAVAPMLRADSLVPAGDEPGDDAPNWERGLDGPVPAGVVRLPELGGIRFVLEADRFVVQQGPAYTIVLHEDDQDTRPAEVDLLAPTASSDGEPLTTIEDLLSALADDVGADLVPIGEVVTELGVAHGFEYTVDEATIDLDRAWLQIGEGGWDPYPFGQFWLLDTERGLFMVTAEAVDPGPLLDQAVVTAAHLLETVELADLDSAG